MPFFVQEDELKFTLNEIVELHKNVLTRLYSIFMFGPYVVSLAPQLKTGHCTHKW